MRVGKVYKIIHNQSNLVYVGSTFHKRLNDRMRHHKDSYNRWIEGKARKCSIYTYFKEYGLENFKMILIKEYNVCDKKHLRVYEQLWISKLKSCNKNSSFYIKKLSDKHYSKINKEK